MIEESILQVKALQLHKKVKKAGGITFVASTGWLDQLKKRMDLFN